MALLSKSVTSTLPAAILLLCWWRRGRIRASDVCPLVPMFLAGAAVGSLTGWMEKHVVGAIGPDFDFLTPLDRCCIAGRAFWFYLAKLVWPAPFSFIYPHWQIESWQLDFSAFGSSGIGGSLAAEAANRPGAGNGGILFRRNAFSRAGICECFSDAIFVRRGSFPISGVHWPDRAGRRVSLARYRYFFGTFAILAIPGLCVASNLRIRVYLDRRTLWADTLH